LKKENKKKAVALDKKMEKRMKKHGHAMNHLDDDEEGVSD